MSGTRNDMHGIIFSYERQNALRELAEPRCAGSIPFGGRYRAVDFMLSNMVNADITDVGVVMHGKFQSLIDHLGNGKAWDLSRKHGGLKLLPLAASLDVSGEHEFYGRVAALGGVMSYLRGIRQSYVVLASSDIIVNLPLKDVLATHIASGADITAVCTGDLGASPNSPCFTLDEQSFVSASAVGLPTPRGHRSLEIFLLSTEKLISLVEDCLSRNITSWSRGVLMGAGRELTVKAYVWDGYAARITGLQQYYEKSCELLDPAVAKELFCLERPIRAKDSGHPSTYIDANVRCCSSLIADGCIIEGNVVNSILFPGVRVEKGAEVSNCILFKDVHVGAGSVLRCAILDKRVRVLPDRTLMGHEKYPLVVAKDSEI
mgnify:CR=1 FL=1